MKRLSISAFACGILLSGIVAAQQVHPGNLSGDEFYSGGILLENVVSTEVGKASVTLGGDGSLTVANAAGGFPRMMVTGGTTISSDRDVDGLNDKTAWQGQLSAPSKGLGPSRREVTVNSNDDAEYEVVEAYIWGLSNEAFTFSPAAAVVLPVSNQQNGQRLWVAYPGADESWSFSDSDSCIVENELCYIEVSQVNRLALIKKNYYSCPVPRVSNGSVAGTPTCIVSCDAGFDLSHDGLSCVEFDPITETEEDTVMPDLAADQELVPTGETAVTTPDYNVRPGYFRYRGSKENLYRELTEDGLMDESLDTVRQLNTTSIARNPQSAEAQLAATETATAEPADETGFMNYVLQMRNHFGDNSQSNQYAATEVPTEEEVVEVGEIETEETEEAMMYSSAGFLPSTGTGVFLVVGLVGIFLMLMGFRRN